VIHTFEVDVAEAAEEFGTSCQRLIPWATPASETPFGAMACFLAPGARSAPDCHDQDEVVLVLGGEAEVRIGADSVQVTPRQLVFLPRNQTHVVVNTSSTEQLAWLSLYWPLHEPPPQSQSQSSQSQSQSQSQSRPLERSDG
jgi:mannose-6-phosphate isomerase-like protein (cupin superfamily)